MRFGKPDVLYLDNGKIYRSEWLKRACVRLGIKIVYTKPYSPEAHGKAEAFNRRADAFLSEVALQKCETLDELNHYLEVWIDGYYHKNNHSGLGNISPVTAFSLDPRPLQFVSDKALREAFLHTEERLVDKTGCISFNGKQYEVGIKLMGQKVEVVYDPACTDQIEIHHRDFEPFFAKPLEIGPFCGVRKEIPEEKKLLDAESSRLLEGLDKTANTKRTSAAIATSFRRIRRWTTMYEAFFEMKHTPFTNGIPTDRLYMSPMFEETLGRLEYVAENQLFAVVTSDVGCGKTTAVRKFTSELDTSRFTYLYISDSQLTPRWLYNGLLEQLGCEPRFYRGDAKRLLHQQLELLRMMYNKRIITIIDESHLMTRETLEELRFLLNYRMDSKIRWHWYWLVK